MIQTKRIIVLYATSAFLFTTSHSVPNIYVSQSANPSSWEQDYVNKRFFQEKNTLVNFIRRTSPEKNVLTKEAPSKIKNTTLSTNGSEKKLSNNSENETTVKNNSDKKTENQAENNEFRNLTFDQLPTIALVGSGGGMRAHLAFLGTMKALQKINLLNGIRYASTLSGSTWMLGTFLSWADLNNRNLGLSDFSQYVKERSKEGLLDGDDIANIDDIVRKIATKIANNERVQPSDIWGMIVIHRLMSDLNGKEHDITFKNIRNILNNTSHCPFPIFTSVITNEADQYGAPFQWLEINPYTTGCPYVKGFVPTSYFESEFSAGRLRTSYPESSLGEYLGVFGSAYSVTSQDADRHTDSKILAIINSLLSKLKDLPIHSKLNIDPTKKRLLDAEMNNFTYKMNARLGKDKTLTLVDAGMDSNLPFPPLFTMNRNIDIFIVCDASADIGKYRQLKEAANYAHRNGIPFPYLYQPEKHYVTIENNTYEYLVFKENRKPTIIYFPNPISNATVDFTYNEDEFDELVETMFEIVSNARNTIATEITEKLGHTTKESIWANNNNLFLDPYPENTSQPGLLAFLVNKISWLLTPPCFKEEDISLADNT